MSKETENEAFTSGILVGVGLQQQQIVAAHKRKVPLIVGDTLYYLQTGRERLEEVLNKICQ